MTSLSIAFGTKTTHVLYGNFIGYDLQTLQLQLMKCLYCFAVHSRMELMTKSSARSCRFNPRMRVRS